MGYWTRSYRISLKWTLTFLQSQPGPGVCTSPVRKVWCVRWFLLKKAVRKIPTWPPQDTASNPASVYEDQYLDACKGRPTAGFVCYKKKCWSPSISKLIILWAMPRLKIPLPGNWALKLAGAHCDASIVNCASKMNRHVKEGISSVLRLRRWYSV